MLLPSPRRRYPAQSDSCDVTKGTLPLAIVPELVFSTLKYQHRSRDQQEAVNSRLNIPYSVDQWQVEGCFFIMMNSEMLFHWSVGLEILI